MVFGKFIEGIAKARIDDKFGFIYPTGKVAISIQFDYCEDFDRGYAIIKQQNNWGAIDKKSSIIIEPEFTYHKVSATLKEKYGRQHCIATSGGHFTPAESSSCAAVSNAFPLAAIRQAG